MNSDTNTEENNKQENNNQNEGNNSLVGIWKSNSISYTCNYYEANETYNHQSYGVIALYDDNTFLIKNDGEGAACYQEYEFKGNYVVSENTIKLYDFKITFGDFFDLSTMGIFGSTSEDLNQFEMVLNYDNNVITINNRTFNKISSDSTKPYGIGIINASSEFSSIDISIDKQEYNDILKLINSKKFESKLEQSQDDKNDNYFEINYYYIDFENNYNLYVTNENKIIEPVYVNGVYSHSNEYTIDGDLYSYLKNLFK